MATNSWLGQATPTARVITLTVGGTVADPDTVTYTINGKAVTVTVGSGDVEADVAAALYAALAASDAPEFQEVSWEYTALDDFVTGTARTPGVPWSGTASDTGTTTLTQAEVTASDGPSHVDSTGNWSLGALPGAGDDVLIARGADGLWGFENLSAAAYNSFKVMASFAGAWGLPAWNPAGYTEYRGRSHPLATAIPATVGEGEGSAPTRVNLTVTTAVALTVHKTGARADADVPAVNVAGMSSGTISIPGPGDVGVAADDSTLSGTVTTAGLNDEATLTVGSGATVTTCNNNGGTVVAFGTVTTLNQTDGEASLYAAPTTVTCDGGVVYGRFTGTVTTATFRQPGAVLDFSRDNRARTITNGSFAAGGTLRDPDKTVTMTNGQTWDAASLAAATLPKRFTLTIA